MFNHVAGLLCNFTFVGVMRPVRDRPITELSLVMTKMMVMMMMVMMMMVMMMVMMMMMMVMMLVMMMMMVMMRDYDVDGAGGSNYYFGKFAQMESVTFPMVLP